MRRSVARKVKDGTAPRRTIIRKGGDATADRGLGQTKRVPGAGEAAVLGDGEQGSDVPDGEVHLFMIPMHERYEE
jgi:hypothetical protein